jgi:phospholipase/carboxylesterase
MTSDHDQDDSGPDYEHIFDPGDSGRTLLLLHGTGGDENDLVPLAKQISPGDAVLSPRGKILENGVHRRFFRRLAVGDLDIPDLLARTDELAGFVKASAERYGFDPGRVTAIGLSNGANIAVSLLFRHPGLLKGAGLLRPMLPYEPPEGLALSGTAVFIAAGGQDPYVPPGQSVELERALQNAGAEVKMRLDEAAGHGLSQEDLRELAVWLAGG